MSYTDFLNVSPYSGGNGVCYGREGSDHDSQGTLNFYSPGRYVFATVLQMKSNNTGDYGQTSNGYYSCGSLYFDAVVFFVSYDANVLCAYAAIENRPRTGNAKVLDDHGSRATLSRPKPGGYRGRSPQGVRPRSGGIV